MYQRLSHWTDIHEFVIGDLYENLSKKNPILVKIRRKCLALYNEDLSMFYWYWRHKLAIKELLCKIQYCCSFDGDMYYLNTTQK